MDSSLFARCGKLSWGGGDEILSTI